MRKEQATQKNWIIAINIYTEMFRANKTSIARTKHFMKRKQEWKIKHANILRIVSRHLDIPTFTSKDGSNCFPANCTFCLGKEH